MVDRSSFSGVAYSIVHPHDDPNDVHVHTVRNWEGRLPGRTVSNKVPTLIAFDTKNDNKPYWGFDIPQHLESKTIKFVKLLLEPNASRKISSLNDVVDPEANGDILRKLEIEPVDAATQYIKLLWEHAKQQIVRHVTQATFDFAEKVVLFTVPAVWSDRAKHNTYMIAVGAGLADDDITLEMVSEPEAAAIAVLKDRSRMRSIVKEDVFVVVDAGGGTVDLANYQVKNVSPLSLEEVVAGDGDLCGAAFLEVNFRRLLREQLGEKVMTDLARDHEDRIICDWEDSIRATFTGEDDRRYMIVTPGIPNSASNKIKSGMMHLKAADIHVVFDPVVMRVEKLVEEQVLALASHGLRPKAIILVGGLGCNRYVAKQLQQKYTVEEQANGKTPIEVQQPDTAWESVAHGAVRCEVLGLGSIVSLRIARYNVGFTQRSKWEEGKYPESMKTIDEHLGGFCVHKAIKWALKRNEKMENDKSVNLKQTCYIWEDNVDKLMSSYSRKQEQMFYYDFVASPEDNAPKHPTKYTRAFASVKFPWDIARFPKTLFRLKESPSGRQFREVEFELHMQYSMAGMRFSYSINNVYAGEIHSVEFVYLPDEVENDEVMSIAGLKLE